MKTFFYNVSMFFIFISLLSPFSLAMEEGNQPPSGKQEIEETVAKGKRKAEESEPAEAEITVKKEKTGQKPFLIKDLQALKRVLNKQTGEHEIKNVVVDSIIINDEENPELFTGTTFEDLIKERTGEGLYYVLAAVTTELKNVEKTDYYDAFQFMTYMFGSDFTQAQKNRYTENQNTFKPHPSSKLSFLGPIKFYIIKNIDDPSFTYSGSDYDLHASADEKLKTFLKRFFKANTPNEVIGPDLDALGQRTENQLLLGEYFYKNNDYDKAIPYFMMIEKSKLPKELRGWMSEDETGMDFPIDATAYLALIYYKQKKYDEALHYLKLLGGYGSDRADFNPNALIGEIYFNQKKFSEALPYLEKAVTRLLKFEQTINPETGQSETKEIRIPLLSVPREKAELLGKTYYELKQHDKALQYLKMVSNPSEEIISLIKQLEQEKK